MVREPAWWDEVGQEPAPQAEAPSLASFQKVRFEQTEFWTPAGKPAFVPRRTARAEATAAAPKTTAGAPAEVPPAPAREATSLYPPNDHDRPSATTSGVGDTLGASAPMRPVVAAYRKAARDTEAVSPRVPMARFLRLNGMLQSGRELRDGLELPRRDFRARFKFLAERHLPLDPAPDGGGWMAVLRRNVG